MTGCGIRPGANFSRPSNKCPSVPTSVLSMPVLIFDSRPVTVLLLVLLQFTLMFGIGGGGNLGLFFGVFVFALVVHF